MNDEATVPPRRRRVSEEDNAVYNQPTQPVFVQGRGGRGRVYAGARAFRAARAAPQAQPAQHTPANAEANPEENPQPNAMPAFNPQFRNAIPQANFHFAAQPNHANPFDFSQINAAINIVNPSQPSRDVPWRFANISAFNSCIHSIKPLSTENWVSFKLDFMLLEYKRNNIQVTPPAFDAY